MQSPRLSFVVVLFALQIALLTIGINRDYRLKHEDNNALHATFARSHLHLGFKTTRGQNYFYAQAEDSGEFYAHHPPGPGLVLAFVYNLTGHDGPFTTRATAILFHLFATALFLSLASRVFKQEWEVLLATLIFVVLPESAFFGRMLNHEVLVLPAVILLVRGYWELVQDGGSARWMAAVVIGSVWAALAGWAGFFAIAACVAHAGSEALVRRNARAPSALAVLVVVGGLLFAVDVAHLVWVQDAGLGYLGGLLASRMGSDADYGIGQWVGRVMELHWRYFSLTGLLAMSALGYRVANGLRAGALRDPAVDVGSIFLVAGAAYVAVFNLNAAQHDYWQFLLLPASAIGIVLVFRWLATRIGQSRWRTLHLVLLILAGIEITGITSFTLAQRHMQSEAYCLETVEALRRDAL